MLSNKKRLKESTQLWKVRLCLLVWMHGVYMQTLWKLLLKKKEITQKQTPVRANRLSAKPNRFKESTHFANKKLLARVNDFVAWMNLIVWQCSEWVCVCVCLRSCKQYGNCPSCYRHSMWLRKNREPVVKKSSKISQFALCLVPPPHRGSFRLLC